MIDLFFEPLRFHQINKGMPIKLGEEIASGQKVYYISSNRRIQYSNCIVLDLNLDFGKIKEMISKDRLKAICQLKSAYLLDEKQIENEVSLYEHEILRKMDFIKQLIQEGQPIRLWNSGHASSLCGISYLCYLMDKNHGDIYLVDYSREDLNVDNFEAIACSARCLNDGEIEKYAKKWQQIDDKSIMRIVVSEEIQSVSDAYFESLILDCLKDNPLKQIDCLKSSQFNSEVYLSPLLFSYTVKKLIDCGKIIVVEDCEYLLKRKLKKGIEC